MDTIVFKSSVHPLSKLIMIGLPIGLIILPILILNDGEAVTADFIACTIMLVTAVLSIWVLADTKYVIQNNAILIYNSGPIKGKIDIQSIRKIEHQKGWISKSILKPSLDINGLYIYYNKFDDIYFSPKDKEAFVNYLLKINPKIEII
ncbi:PH domain-containing protein [Flavobacterium sp.]|uniref:PH domain-containing protein n=1 Tax=Flavobacterium sp. TaxID=239 RepID=UPI0037BEF1C5